jgi:hypothetical protein
MGNTNFSSSNGLTVKAWSERTLYDFTSDKYLLGQMIKAGVIRRQDELSRKSGDQVTIPFLNRITQMGFVGNAVALGNESPLLYYNDALVINQLRQAVSIPNKRTIDAQRVQMNLSEDTYKSLSDWHKVRGVLGALNQLAGNNATTIAYDSVNYSGNDRLQVTGLNSAIAPSTASGVTRIVRPNSLTTDQAVGADTTATMKLQYILDCETIAQTARPYIPPLAENPADGVKYHFYVHIQQYNNLLQDTTSPYQYRDIQNAMITSGRGSGGIERSFVFSETKVFCTDKIPLGVHSGTSAAVANCRRAIFAGADAGAISFGQGFSGSGDAVPGFDIMEDTWDIGQQRLIAMSGIYGIKKLQFNSNDNGSIVVSTYSSI